MVMEWNEAYSVGIAKLDEQHKRLLSLLNQAHRLGDRQHQPAELNRLASSMLAYAFSHFTTEEELMRAYDYPDYLPHMAMHNSFKQQANRYQLEAANGEGSSRAVVAFLSEWLEGHINGSDKKLGRFLNKLGINQP